MKKTLYLLLFICAVSSAQDSIVTKANGVYSILDVDLRGLGDGSSDFQSTGTNTTTTFTLSVGTSTAPDAPYDYINESHLIADSNEDFAIQGGWRKTSSTLWTIPSTSIRQGGFATELGTIWKASFKISGRFSIRINGVLSGYQLEIDGVIHSITDNQDTGTGTRWLTVDAGKGVHYVKVVGTYGTWWMGYVTEKSALAEPWTPTRNTFIFGDSFTVGVGADVLLNGYSQRLALSTNSNVVSSGITGTGYVNASTHYILGDRILNDLGKSITEYGIPDEVVVAMGYNDKDLTSVLAPANDVFDKIRTLYSGKVYVIGPWDSYAPSSPTSGWESVNEDLKTAVNGRSGFSFIDMKGFSFPKNDGDVIHPSTEGHQMIADHLRNIFLETNSTTINERVNDLQTRILNVYKVADKGLTEVKGTDLNYSGGFSTGYNKLIELYGGEFRTIEKSSILFRLTGTTAQRPTANLLVGYTYFDTTLGYPIYWNGTNWVDGTGTVR